ncbi:MAG: hypothetical protein HOQ24_13665 [Mycobacteriaceae bacterium]|nr:hypothetical protein [Mycobacteriaceae bacterium]
MKNHKTAALAALLLVTTAACSTDSATADDNSAQPTTAQAQQPPGQGKTLTGQDIGEAQGSLELILEDSIAGSGVNTTEYVVLKALGARGPQAQPNGFYEFLTQQRQLKLDKTAAVALVNGLVQRGLVTDPGAGALAVTDAGAQLNKTLADRVAPITSKIFADISESDLQTAHRVLRSAIDKAHTLRGTR